jgi:hypothetical protein
MEELMNMDQIFDKMEKNPVGFLVGMWVFGALISLAGLVVAILVVVGVLNAVGVL